MKYHIFLHLICLPLLKITFALLFSLATYFFPQPFLFHINYSWFYAPFPISGFCFVCLSLLMCIPTGHQ